MIYFRVLSIEPSFSIFIWFWFFAFVGFVLVFGFCNFFIYFFYFGKFKCGGMLASRLWKSLLFLTHSSQAFSWVFCIAFYHFNSLLLTFITGFCSGIPCSSVSHFVETSYLTFIAIQLTGCHVMRYLVWRFSKQITNSLHVFICVYIYVPICMCVFICMCV